MSTGNGQTVSDDFSRRFEKIEPLIRDEWPAIDAGRLAQTKGDYDAVVALVAEQTKHTKTLVKKQLEELRRIAEGENGAGDLRAFRQLLERMQARSLEIAGYIKNQMMPEATQQVKKNFLVTVLLAVGFGFILGFFMRGGRRS
jgi:hypothetical protein